MPIPSYEDAMLPFLRVLDQGGELFVREIAEILAREFRLSPEELSAMIPSGQSTVFANRVGWARTYLKKAGLIEPVARARYILTRRGKDLLSTKPTRIDGTILRQYPEFLEFIKPRVDEASELQVPTPGSATPLEVLEEGYEQLRQQLADELLQTIRSGSPAFFERLVVEVLVKMGYGGSLKDAGKAVGKSGDGGIDGIIKEDRLGLDQIYIQAKRWANVVGRPEIQSFAGTPRGEPRSQGRFHHHLPIHKRSARLCYSDREENRLDRRTGARPTHD
jgi:restriction system protein